MPSPAAADLLSLGPLQRIRIDLTTRCNLRCVYCAVSQFDYHGTDISRELALKTIQAITQLSDCHRLDAVHVNGHGETTFLDGWVDYCRPLIARNLPVMITTNLAKDFSPDELETLARMDSISVSIDTCDPDLLKRLRRKVDIRQIVMNVNRIRSTSLRLDCREPSFEFSCGLYDRNALFVEDLARFAVALRIDRVGFWNLTKWDYEAFPYWKTDVAESDRAYPLDTLSPALLSPRLEAIQRAMAILSSNGVVVEMNGNFVETLARQVESRSPETAKFDALELPQGMTRNCIDPWTYFEVGSNGDVKPCCAREGVGNMGSAHLADILENENIRQLRVNLLNGTPDSVCAKCTLRTPIQPELLKQKIEVLLLELSAAKNGVSSLRKPAAAWSSASAAVTSNRLFGFALKEMAAGRKTTAWIQVCHGLAVDPAIASVVNYGDDTIRNYLDPIMAGARFPSTLSSLAGVSREIGDHATAWRLLERYLELAPAAPDREHVQKTLEDEAQARRRENPLTTRIASTLAAFWFAVRGAVRFRTRIRAVFARLRTL